MDMVFPYAFAPNSYPDLVKEGFLPHKVKEIWLWVPEQPNYRVDVASTYELKEKAIKCHRSQIEDWMESPGPDCALWSCAWLTGTRRDDPEPIYDPTNGTVSNGDIWASYILNGGFGYIQYLNISVIMIHYAKSDL
jgi:hypothetical protein